METTEKRLLSENEFSRLHLKVVSKSNSLTEADKLIFQEQLELRRQVAEAARQKKFEERQARLAALNAEAAKLEPPKPIEREEIQSSGWVPFIQSPQVAILVKKDVSGNPYGFACRKRASDGKVLPLVAFETLQAGPVGNFLQCAAKVREMLG
ncbi:MAG: hypothetical protein JNN04_07400 [Cyclobacteriaceae bacterium]|nr:hypothetical protein [Cyclobacteriaceae bacterium]